MKTYSCLADRLTVNQKYFVSGRWGEDYETFMRLVNGAIERVSGGLGSSDFSDTVFTVDAWEAGADPADTAEEILNGDCCGAGMLALYLGQEVEA